MLIYNKGLKLSNYFWIVYGLWSVESCIVIYSFKNGFEVYIFN